MSNLFSGKIVNITALKKILSKKVFGMTFDDKQEATQYIDELVCDLVERPMYDESDLTHDDGHTAYDLIDNVDELRDMQNDIISLCDYTQ
jgi:hypothetical protein